MRLALPIVLAFAATCLAGDLNESEFDRISGLLRPPKQELWKSVPWKITVLEGRRTAIEEGKPIFIWAMDGHPLGCT
jgi:hypothetical protein